VRAIRLSAQYQTDERPVRVLVTMREPHVRTILDIWRTSMARSRSLHTSGNAPAARML
jgi:hypothetical protein